MFQNIRIKMMVLMLVIVCVASACSGQSDSDTSMNTTSSNLNSLNIATSQDTADSVSDDQSSVKTDAKVVEQLLIYTGTMKISTNRFEETIEVIFSLLEQAGGYMIAQEDTSNEQTKVSSIVVRVPSEQFFSWIEGVEQIPDIKISKNISAEDVSEEYVDLVARQEAKLLVIEKYKQYMELAETADELIRYTNELAALQEEVEAVQARIRYLQNHVAYSTITIKIEDEKTASFLSGLQLKDRFTDSFESGIYGLVWVVTAIISILITLSPLLLIIPFIYGVVYILKRIKSNRKKQTVRLESQESQQAQTQQTDLEVDTQSEAEDSQKDK